MENQIDISTKTVEELQAMGFAIREQVDILNNNLNIVRNLIAQKTQAEASLAIDEEPKE